MELTHSDRSALWDALSAWRDLLWVRYLADRRCELDLWSRILTGHLEASR